MRTMGEIEAKIALIMQKHEKIETSRRAELKKQIFSRNKNCFYFYYLEDSINKAVLEELMWFMNIDGE